MEAFEEMYCRISALELLVLAMGQQLNKATFSRDLERQKDKLLATASFATLSSEAASRLTGHIDRYERLLLSNP